MDEALRSIYELISKMGPQESQMPIVIIGGGAFLLPKKSLDSRFSIPQHADVANAYGAALAEISATIDTVVSLEHRQKVLDELNQQAIQAAIQKGADYKPLKLSKSKFFP